MKIFATMTRTCVIATALLLALPSAAAVKSYDASLQNGTPGDQLRNSIGNSPPVVATPGSLEGIAEISDDGLGTVTLSQFTLVTDSTTDITAGEIVPLFGPGAFFFSPQLRTQFITSPHVSNTSGVGAHGPSSTAPGASAEWGIVSGWEVTGSTFCISSPTIICDNNVVPHGTTQLLENFSNTYDLGTWWFDAEGDADASPFIVVTASGGLTNILQSPHRAFQGASLPALPVVGFGLLACAMAVMGGRALRGSR
jgi:hypothetical protein